MAFSPPHILNSRAWKNLKIGLFGGTFNPPHEGHFHICNEAIKTQKFDFIWWMITPQNPLKRDQDIPSFDIRKKWSEEYLSHPKIIITDIEKELKTYKSIDTVRALKTHFSNTEFTFILGMDNALTMHKWEDWKELTNEIPFLIIARPPSLSLIKNHPLRMLKKPNIEYILQTKMVDQSSTKIRKKLAQVENIDK